MKVKVLDELLGRESRDPFVAVDIGTSGIKVIEFDMFGDKPRLVALGSAATPAGAISNNLIAKPQAVALAIRSLLDQNDIKARKAVVALPGPSVFSKKVTVGYIEPRELDAQIRFEAGNYIPHKLDAVKLDYQVLKVNGTSSIDVLLVAVKNEIIESYVVTLEQAGLEPAIADVDYFALENMFELNYPEERSKTVALVNIGARYSAVTILKNGESLFTGDVGVGGRLYTDALCEHLGLQPADAERAKSGHVPLGVDEQLVHDTLERTTEHVSSELQRQIGFYWNAAATDTAIEAIYISGGASQVPGLFSELGAKTGIPCLPVEPFRNVEWSGSFDRELVAEMSPVMSVGAGLALRRFRDKRNATA